jgi:hypothetical protein
MRKPLAGGVFLCWMVCEFGVFHFRRVFELEAKPSSFVVHVSADNRYRFRRPASESGRPSPRISGRTEATIRRVARRQDREFLARIRASVGRERQPPPPPK